MIPNNKTINGKDFDSLSFSSKERVMRICDLCGERGETSVNTILRCRKKHNTTQDYCLSCSIKMYNTGENNSAKKPSSRLKISINTKGKSKSFKDGKNLRILDRKVNAAGHILKWCEEEKKHILEHRLIYAEFAHKHHSELNEIHHINGIKTDNSISNLIELSSSEHGALHSQLEKIAFELVRNNSILFDRVGKKYVLSPQLYLSTLEKSLGFEQIAIKQKKNICESRLSTNIRSEVVRGIFLDIPMIAANMSTVVNADFCIKLYKLGALGIMHRAANEDHILQEVTKISKQCDIVAASIGIESSQFDLAKSLIRTGANIITIDIAHGFSDAVFSIAKKIKLYSPSTKIIIGNTTNPDMLIECYDFVDAIKVGIAQGLACETKNTAGCTEKQFSALMKFKTLSRNFGIPIISDGGIREPADFTKAIAAGANSIMAGSIFAACPESAAEIDTKYSNRTGETISQHKIYAGMASEYVQNRWKGGLKPGTCAEGGVRYLEIGDPADKLLERYSGALRSGITYAGGYDIVSLQNNVEFIQI